MQSTSCRRSLVAAFAGVLALAGIAVAVDPGSSQPSDVRRLDGRQIAAVVSATTKPRAKAVSTTEAPPTTTTTTAPPAPVLAPPPPPAVPPPLPRPAPLPAQWARVPLVEKGRIQIPKIGVDQVVHQGVEQMVIDAGPAWWPGTAEFGGWGNVVLAGHRTTHTEPFRRTGELVPGDLIQLSDPTGGYTYRVTGSQVVNPSALWIVDQHPGRTLTIFTCHPIGSSAERLVIHAELVSPARPGN
jgi:sortase A